MSDIKNDEVQLTEALQTVQRLYMKLLKKKECVAFYIKHIQPIYAEFEANGENKSTDKALILPDVSVAKRTGCPVCWKPLEDGLVKNMCVNDECPTNLGQTEL